MQKQLKSNILKLESRLAVEIFHLTVFPSKEVRV